MFSTFGETLKVLRRRARLTQLELSIAVGYSEAHISRLETGQRLPEVAAVAALFIPALRLEDAPEEAGRLMQLAAAAREQGSTSSTVSSLVVTQTISEGAEELPPTNLAYPLDRFIGRASEMQLVKGWLASGRVVTLCGPGGVGKTRLATELAWQLLPQYQQGICLVQLAEKAASSDLTEALAADLEIHETGRSSLNDALVAFLRPKQMLLVLDNCEHLVSRLAPLVRDLLGTCPGLTLLATSREPLHISGEQVFRVPPLQQSDETQERSQTSEAVELFMERAHSAAPSIHLDPATAHIATDICRRLDGMPLAIELAAARLSALTIEQLHQRLDESLSLVSLNDRVSSQRRQTPLGVVEWSYRLLSAPEQRLLRRLSVFSGGWTMPAAEAIAGGKTAFLLDIHSELIDKSLVLLEKDPTRGPRYRMLETVRQFSLGELRRRKEEVALRGRHLNYFLALAREFDQNALGTDRRDWLARMDAEHENFKAALAFAKRAGGEDWWHLVGDLGWYWHARGLVSEGLAEVKPLLSRSKKKNAKKPSAALRAKAAWLGGGLYWIRGDLGKGLRILKESIALWRLAGSRGRRGLAAALREAGIVATSAEKWKEAQAFLEEALSLWRRQQRPADLALTLYNYGYFLEATGEADRARALFAESLGLCRAHRLDWVASVALFGLGRIAGRNGELSAAKTLLEESLELFRQDEDPWGAAESLSWLGELALSDGRQREAAFRFRECLLLNMELGDSGLQEVALHGLGKIAFAEGQSSQALRLMASAAQARQTGGSGPRSLSKEADRQREFADVQASFPEGYAAVLITTDEAIVAAQSLAGNNV